jgi:hypothetical protein
MYASSEPTGIDREQAQRHLELLGYVKGDKIYVRYIHPDPAHTPKSIKKSRLNWEECDRYQSEGYDCYFVVNGGGDSDKAVKAGRALFIEHDDLDKTIQRDLWQSLGLPEPTVQVDTGGKSIHSYWVFEQPIPIADWVQLQADLLEFSAGDRTIKNPSRIMRLAGSLYQKGQNPGSTRAHIISESGNRYSYQELRGCVPDRDKTIDERPSPDLNGDVSLYACLTKDDRSLIDSGVSEGGRNASGAKLARNLIGTQSRLLFLGYRCPDDPRQLFDEYCDRCTPSIQAREREQIWRKAEKSNPSASLTDEALHNCAKAYLWNQQGGMKKRVRGGGNGGNGGGDGGDGGKIVKFPFLEPLTNEQVNQKINELISQGANNDTLRSELNELSHNSNWHISQLYKLHQEKLQNIERVELRENTLDQLESLLRANNTSLDLNKFLHPHLAKPLLHLASRLNLKPEVYLTTLLTVASSLHHPKTRIWLSQEDDFDQPPSLYAGIVAPSSQKKSPILKALAYKPLGKLWREDKKNHERDLRAYEQELADWEELSKEEKKEKDPPSKPERAVLYFNQTNGEGLDYQAARQQNQGMLYLADEVASIVYSQNQYRGGKGSDRQNLLSYYDGTGNITLRADGIKSEFDNILLSILGGIQPSVLQKLLANCEDSDGNWARFLFINQPAVAGKLHKDGGKVDLTGLLTNIYRKIRALPEQEYIISPEAFELFQQAYDRYEQNRVNDPLPGMQSVWGKSEGRVGRLALNLHVLNALASGETPSTIVGAETMARAIALTDYYAMQVKAMYTEFSDSDALAPHLAKVIEMSLKRLTSKNEGWLKASDVYLSITKSKRPDGGTVREWFTELVTLGKGEVKGSGRLLQFRAFNPKLDKLDTKLDKSSNAENTVYQQSQGLLDKLDKLDKLDDFGKIPTETAFDTGLDTPSNKISRVKFDPSLEKSSNLSKNPQNIEQESDTALDGSSKESSNLDDLGAISPDPIETPPTIASDPTIAPDPNTSGENAIAPDPTCDPLYGWMEMHNHKEYPNPKSNSIKTSQQRALRIRSSAKKAQTKQDLSALRCENGGDFSENELRWVQYWLMNFHPSEYRRLKETAKITQPELPLDDRGNSSE